MIDVETFSKFLKATDEVGEFFNFVDASANCGLRNCHQNPYLINRFLPHIRQPVRADDTPRLAIAAFAFVTQAMF